MSGLIQNRDVVDPSQFFDCSAMCSVSDAHTLGDRPHLAAPDVIRHHNWLWGGLLTNRSIRVATTAELIAESP